MHNRRMFIFSVRARFENVLVNLANVNCRKLALVLLFSAIPTCLLSLSANAQQQQPPLDSKAVAVLHQALSSAGGVPAFNAISDYIGTGSITYYQPETVQGNVTVRGRDLDYFRVDASLPVGDRSEAISDGEMTLKSPKGTVDQAQWQAPIAPSRIVLPYLLLASIVDSDAYSLSYQGLAKLDGKSTHHIQIELIAPGQHDSDLASHEYKMIDFFIDASTFQVIMMQDVIPNHTARKIRYSDYALVGGVLVPLSISEESGGLPTWLIHLEKISFNSGLQVSDFQLSASKARD